MARSFHSKRFHGCEANFSTCWKSRVFSLRRRDRHEVLRVHATRTNLCSGELSRGNRFLKLYDGRKSSLPRRGQSSVIADTWRTTSTRSLCRWDGIRTTRLFRTWPTTFLSFGALNLDEWNRRLNKVARVTFSLLLESFSASRQRRSNNRPFWLGSFHWEWNLVLVRTSSRLKTRCTGFIYGTVVNLRYRGTTFTIERVRETSHSSRSLCQLEKLLVPRWNVEKGQLLWRLVLRKKKKKRKGETRSARIWFLFSTIFHSDT